MTLNSDQLKKLKSKKIKSEDERKRLGPELVETVSEGGQNGIKAAKLLIKNSMSYYVYQNEEILYNSVVESRNFSYIYACSQLVEFLYENHGVSDKLPNILTELLSFEDAWVNERKAYATDLYRFYGYDTEDPQTICQKEFNEDFSFERETDDKFETDEGRRIKLDQSDRRGILLVEDQFVEFEFYNRIGKKVLDSSIKGIEYLKKSVSLVFSIIRDMGKNKPKILKSEFEETTSKAINICGNMIGEVADEAFKTLVKVSDHISDKHNMKLIKNLLTSVQDGFSLTPMNQLLDYIINKNGDIQQESDVKNVLKKEFGISEQKSFLLNYETDSQKRKCYSCLALIDNKEGWKNTMISFGFTQFYFT